MERVVVYLGHDISAESLPIGFHMGAELYTRLENSAVKALDQNRQTIVRILESTQQRITAWAPPEPRRSSLSWAILQNRASRNR